MTNPYREAGRVAVGDRFLGRALLVRYVADTWQVPGRPSNTRVVGHHRVGKTSIVRRALDTLPPDADVIPVWLNVGSQDSGMDIYRSMVRSVRRRLPDVRHLESVARAIQAADQWYDLLEGVRTFFAGVKDDLGLNVLVVLDEFDRAATAFDRLAQFQLLRDLASEPDYSVGLITISRRDIEKIEIAAAGGSILGGVVSTTRYVGMFSDAEVDLMLARSVQAGISLHSARGAIMERTGPHPFLLESFCKRIIEIYEVTGKIDVAEAFSQESATIEAQFTNLLDAVNADTEFRGGLLLRDLALRSQSAFASPDLARLRLTGIAVGNAPFSPEFGRFLTLRPIPQPSGPG
jgi:hypothetical protein